jgi:carbonic anhydrase/acetyltransferase-like protein (isoleucine patch superfamily)
MSADRDLDAPPGALRPRMLRVGEAFVAHNAAVSGRVVLGEGVSIWYGASVRGDDAEIRIGDRTNVQDGVVIHADPGEPNVIGADVTIGHGAILHGVEVRDRALIGMGAVLLAGSIVGEGAVVGAGCVVGEGMEVPPCALAVGVPARIVKTFEAHARHENALESARDYVVQAERHAEGAWDGAREGKGDGGVRPTSR